MLLHTGKAKPMTGHSILFVMNLLYLIYLLYLVTHTDFYFDAARDVAETLKSEICKGYRRNRFSETGLAEWIPLCPADPRTGHHPADFIAVCQHTFP